MCIVMGSTQQHGVNTDSAIEPKDQDVMANVSMRSQRKNRSAYQTHKIVYEIMCRCGSDLTQHNVDFKN